MYQDLTFKLFPYSCCHLPYSAKLNLFPSRYSDNTFFFFLLSHPQYLSTFSKIGKLFHLTRCSSCCANTQKAAQMASLPVNSMSIAQSSKKSKLKFHYTKRVFSGSPLCKCWHARLRDGMYVYSSWKNCDMKFKKKKMFFNPR